MHRAALPLYRCARFGAIGSRQIGQWQSGRNRGRLLERGFADSKPLPPGSKASLGDSSAVVLPGTASQTSETNPPLPPGKIASIPGSAASKADVPPQNVPLTPPPPPGGKAQTAPPSSIPPPSSRNTALSNPKSNPPTSSSPPSPPSSPPAAPKKKTHRFRNFLFTLLLLGGLSYAGGVFYSFRSDNFHDFFTEYIPFGEDAVLYFEERAFRKRFPQATGINGRAGPSGGSRGGDKITIPSKSGLSWKISEDEGAGSDLATKGRHMSALDENTPKSKPKVEQAQQNPSGGTGEEKTLAVEKAKKDSPAPAKPAPPQSNVEPVKEKPKVSKEVKDVPLPKETESTKPKPTPTRSPEVNEPSVYVPLKRIDPLKVKYADEPLVQDLVKVINDIITVVNADSASGKYSSTINKAKSELENVGNRIMALKAGERKAAQDKIKSTQKEFDTAAKELVRRLEEEMRDQESRWKDEFESEREKLSQSYQERMRTEVENSKKVIEEVSHNRLLEQAVALKTKFVSDVKDRVETERNGRLSKLNDLASSVNELEKLTSDWNSVIDANLKTQHLQVAVEAVRSGLDRTDRPRPFIRELAALKEVADDDPVVNAAIASINPTAYQRGIPTTPQIIDRFRRVATEVRKASLLPEDAGVASHAASLFISKFLFKKQGMTVGNDVESILTRTETLLEEGDLDQAAREMNTLTGWAKTLSTDWLGEVRRVLEVRQALDVISTEARLQSLKVD